MATVRIPLTQGKFALVDASDAEWLSAFKWCAWSKKHVDGRRVFYAVTAIPANGKQRMVQMHRMILNAPKGVPVDHENRNGLDNRRSNLRLASYSQNGANRGKAVNSSSPYKGIYYERHGCKWSAAVYDHGKRIYLGRFPDAESAARAYDAKAREVHGEFAYLNFPTEVV